MADAHKPSLLITLIVIIIIVGFYSLLRSGLMIYNSIRQLSSGFGGIFELIIGLISGAIGVLGLAGGIAFFRDRPGSLDIMKKFALALPGYQILWIVFTIASGRITGWGSVILDIIVGMGTFVCLTANEDIKKYFFSLANPGPSDSTEKNC